MEKQNQNNEQDKEIDMNEEFLKDIKNMHQRVEYDTHHVQQQEKRLVAVNDNLDDFNKEVDEYTDIINKGPFSYLKDKITGFFKRDKEKKLDNHDRKVIEKARNKQINNKNNEEKNNLDIMKDEQNKNNNNKVDDEDAVLEEALKEVKERRKDIKKLTSAIKESTEVLDATNNNMDNSIYNVNQAEKKLKKIKRSNSIKNKN